MWDWIASALQRAINESYDPEIVTKDLINLLENDGLTRDLDYSALMNPYSRGEALIENNPQIRQQMTFAYNLNDVQFPTTSVALRPRINLDEDNALTWAEGL